MCVDITSGYGVNFAKHVSSGQGIIVCGTRYESLQPDIAVIMEAHVPMPIAVLHKNLASHNPPYVPFSSTVSYGVRKTPANIPVAPWNCNDLIIVHDEPACLVQPAAYVSTHEWRSEDYFDVESYKTVERVDGGFNEFGLPMPDTIVYVYASGHVYPLYPAYIAGWCGLVMAVGEAPLVFGGGVSTICTLI
jgi:hypothetical protein